MKTLADGTTHIFKTYLRRLTTLSGNSRSLLLLRLHHEQLLDVQQLSYLNNDSAFTVISSLIAEKSKRICPILDSRRKEANEVSLKLKRLQRIDKFIYEEKGSNDLHVGWPFVRGKFSDGTLVRCPLLYFPVSLEQQGDQWVLQPRKEAGITFNKSFLLAYALYNQQSPQEVLLDFTFDDVDTDSIVFRTKLYELLKDKIELNFNPDTFTDNLISFEQFRKEEFEEQSNTGSLKLFSEAVLGIFPQAGSQLVPDYLHLIEQDAYKTMDDFFSRRAVGQSNLNKWIASVREEKIYAPFLLDTHQEHALRAVKSGNSLVVQGPPGTGKSQLISNLMADAIAAGKKVLLVCQKRVALDVVYDRLSDANLNDFLGLVHDFRNDRKEIYTKVAKQIDKIEEYKELNRSIDVIQTERKFLHVCRRIDQLVETLEEFRQALFDDREAGLSAKELYLTSNPNEPGIGLRQEYQSFHFHTLDEFILKLRKYAMYSLHFQRQNYVWHNRQSFADWNVNDRLQIERVIDEIPVVQKHIQNELLAVAPFSMNLLELEELLQRKPKADELVQLLTNETVFHYFLSMLPEKDDEASLLWLQNMERVCLNCFDEEGLESSLPTDQVGVCQQALHERMKARKRIHRLIWWELFSEHKFFLKRVLIANQLQYTNTGLAVLEKRIDNRLNLEHHFTALRKKTWLKQLPRELNRTSIQQWFGFQKQALQAKLLFNSLRELKEVVSPSRHTHAEFIRLIESIFSIISIIPEKKIEWSKYLSAFQLRHLIAEKGEAQEYINTLHADFDALCAFDSLKQSLSAVEISVIGKLNETANTWDAEKLVQFFQNSIRLAWIEHLETKYPVLRSVSTFAMSEMESELQARVKEKQQFVLQILLLRARERVYEQVEYNRLNNRVTYRDLYHQVTKKKKIWPVRKLIAEFEHELFNLIPCWLASPESVSAIFPMREIFDLVIFDEASQCFSERGIPAMYRGKQCVVAGDDKQLKPFELYQVRWNDESESPEAEVDSLLELSERYLPTVWLRGHYRSQSLPLIDFSNRYFYQGKLQLLPNREAVNDPAPPIIVKKFSGVWENQTNLTEANAVVDEVWQLVKENPRKEIGIITFNAPQQMLIMDCLEERCAIEKSPLPNGLFVKNIENVQGDERDIIIFSVGYAPDASGKLSMQFGSLNVAGGENRLNVAVTRAKEKVVVITSIEPEQLQVEEIKNEGPKFLKRYLEYARSVAQGDFRFQELVNAPHNVSWFVSNQVVEWYSTQNNKVGLAQEALPYADIVVQEKNKCNGIILTDDAHYFSSMTAKEPHVTIPALLDQKNWKYTRVYSRQWWIAHNKTAAALSEFIHSLPA